jgi:hypothetical protein
VQPKEISKFQKLLGVSGKTGELGKMRPVIWPRFTSAIIRLASELGLLNGGLSDARVFRVKVFDHSGATRINAVAKIGSRTAISAEARQYDKEVSRLSPDATPRRLDSPDFSDENTAGVFYSLAESYPAAVCSGNCQRSVHTTFDWHSPDARTLCPCGPFRGSPSGVIPFAPVFASKLFDHFLYGIQQYLGVKWFLKNFTRWQKGFRNHGFNPVLNSDKFPTVISYGVTRWIFESPGRIQGMREA